MSEWSAPTPKPGPPVPSPAAFPGRPAPAVVPPPLPGPTEEPAAPAGDRPDTTDHTGTDPDHAPRAGQDRVQGPDPNDRTAGLPEGGIPATTGREPGEQDSGAHDPASDPTQLIDRLDERLRELDEIPISEHPARYEALHTELSEALTVLDKAARSDSGAVPQPPRHR